eukprot:5526114-Amphidinium_carterae.1
MESRAELSMGAFLSLQTGVLLHVEEILDEDRCLYRSHHLCRLAYYSRPQNMQVAHATDGV